MHLQERSGEGPGLILNLMLLVQECDLNPHRISGRWKEIIVQCLSITLKYPLQRQSDTEDLGDQETNKEVSTIDNILSSQHSNSSRTCIESTFLVAVLSGR
jgi:hypothetical protein